MSGLPQGLQSYKRTPTFTETTVPAGLLNDHATKQGVWGLIHVEAGELHYFVTDARRVPSACVLSSLSVPGVVEPTILHRVEARGPVRFHVEFFRAVPAG